MSQKHRKVTQHQPEDAKHWSIELVVLVLAAAIFESLRKPVEHAINLAGSVL